MNLPLYIAKRYLFARKSHNVINIISAISAIGMAIGTAALILIMSVYNGFDRLIRENLSDLDPDILVTASEGKYFVPDGIPAFEALMDDDRIASISSVIEENVFLSYDGKQGLAKAKGVDIVYEEESLIQEHVIEGDYLLHSGDAPMAVLGSSLAWSMGIHPRFLSAIKIYYPERGKNISLINPETSLHSIKIWPSALFSLNADIDKELMILPIECIRELVGTEDAVSALEIRLAPGVKAKSVIPALQKSLGDDYKVLDRYKQHPALYRMMKYEKFAIFLILIFVVIIVALNIFGSLSMLIIEKEDDMATLRAMGADDKLTGRIFVLEGWLISLLGLAAGLVIGIGLTLLQQTTGLVKMPGNFAISAYPVVLQVGDVVLTAAGVAIIGLMVSLLAAGNRKKDTLS